MGITFSSNIASKKFSNLYYYIYTIIMYVIIGANHLTPKDGFTPMYRKWLMRNFQLPFSTFKAYLTKQ